MTDIGLALLYGLTTSTEMYTAPVPIPLKNPVKLSLACHSRCPIRKRPGLLPPRPPPAPRHAEKECPAYRP